MLKAFGEARELDEAPHGWSGVSCQTAASTTSSVLSAAERIRQQHSCTPRRFGVAAAYLTVRRASRIDTSTTKSTTFRKKKILYWVFFVGFVAFEVFVARSLFEFLAVVRRGVGAQPLPSVVRSFSGVDRVLVAVFGPLEAPGMESPADTQMRRGGSIRSHRYWRDSRQQFCGSCADA